MKRVADGYRAKRKPDVQQVRVLLLPRQRKTVEELSEVLGHISLAATIRAIISEAAERHGVNVQEEQS